jgi:hypothetical protein
MEENKLRGLVAKRNRLPDVPDAVWEDLDKEGLIFAAAEGGGEEVEDLLRVAKRRLNLYQAGVEEGAGRASPPGREKEISGSQTVDIELREPEAERGVALSEFLVRLDDEDPTRSAKEARPIKSKITMAWGGERPPLWRITLAVAPWVNAKEVQRAYRLIQRKLIGKDNRPMSLRNIAVFRFVEEILSSDEGGKPSWRKRLALYNERYPKGHEFHFEDADPRNFQRTYERAFAEIVGCGFNYHFPPRKLSPDDKQQAREAWEKAEAIVALDKKRWKNQRKA